MPLRATTASDLLLDLDLFCTGVAASHRKKCEGQLLKKLEIPCGHTPKDERRI